MRHLHGVTGPIGKFGSIAMLAVFAAFITTTEANAQELGGNSHPGNDVLSVNAQAGGFFSGSSFAEGARFDDTGTVGANATFWAHPNVGVRASGLWYAPDLQAGDEEFQLIGESPDVFHYSGDVMLRMPMLAGEAIAGQTMSWYPYILGGVGGKSYDFDALGTETDVTGTFGAGLELRFGETGRWGLQTEVRDFVSNFDRAGVDETLHDVIWTGGISINM